MNEGLCKVSDFGCCVRGLVSALCLFFAVLTVNVTKSPLLLRETGGVFEKSGGLFGKRCGVYSDFCFVNFEISSLSFEISLS